MPALLRYHLQKALSRLHRARIMLLSRGWRASLARATSASTAAARNVPAEPHSWPVLRVPPATDPYPLLWLDERAPDPGQDSGSLRMFNIMRTLVAMGHPLHFLSTSGAPTPSQETALREIGVTCVQSHPPAEAAHAWFRRHGKDYRGVIVSRYHLAWHWFPLVRTINPGALRVLDTVDLHHIRERGEADLRGSAALRRAASATRRHELRAIRNADVTWVVSEIEREALSGLARGARVEVVSNIHEAPADIDRETRAERLVFIGGAQHPPNADAARWLVADIMPRILQRHPRCELHLVGRGLEEACLGLPASTRIVFHGHVAELGELYSNCKIGVAPLRFGAGVKGKVNQYMAFGLPTIATRTAVEGMHLQDGHDVLVADDAAGFADAALRLLEDHGLWTALSVHGRDSVRRHFSVESALPGIRATFERPHPAT